MYLLVFGKNGTSNNGTSGKVGKNGTFSILGFGVGAEGLEWGVCHFYTKSYLFYEKKIQENNLICSG